MQEVIQMTGEIAVLVGTRPEIIKLAPVVHACEELGVPCTIIHTGQHYSETLDAVFFEQLELPDPAYNLEVGSGPHGAQTGEMLIGIENILREEDPAILLVQGDTNSVLAGAIAASKLDIELGHVEAGLRSFDRQMPEETNRVLADHVAEYLFAPSEQSKQHLLAEGIDSGRISVTGNTIVDALQQYRTVAQQHSTILEELDLTPKGYFLMTAHRQENVDDPTRLTNILKGVAATAADYDLPVVYPVHPHTKERIAAFGITVPDRIRLIEPCEYLDFLELQSEARLILTDSGGVQEEACILGVPCVTIRDSTERPETLTVGANELTEPTPECLAASVDRMIKKSGDWENPFGDGQASKRIVQTVVSEPMQVEP